MLRTKLKFDIVYRHYIPILIFAFITSVIGGYFASKLTLQSDLAELLPESYNSVRALNRIKEEVGAVGDLRIIIESTDFKAIESFAHALAAELERSSYVSYLDYKNDVAFYKRNAMLFLEIDELESLYTAIQDKIDAGKQKLNPFFVDDLFGEDEEESTDADLAEWEEKYQDKEPERYYTNEDSTILVMKVIPNGTNTSLDFTRALFSEVKQIVDTVNPLKYALDMKTYYGGSFKKRLEEYDVISSDIMGTAYYGFSGVFLLIVIYFRRLAPAILITFSLFMSLAWTFGVTYLVIGNLNTITGFLVVILFGMGIDYGIHAFARYKECRRSSMSFEESIEIMITQTGKALATTAVTTSAAFFSLMLMDFKGFTELGFIAGIGMLFALVAMVVVLPALITLFEKLKFLKIKPTASKTQSFQRRKFLFSKPILLFSGLITLFAIYTFTIIDFEYDFTNLRAMTDERKISSEKTAGIFKLSESPAVVLADSEEEVNDLVHSIQAIIKKDTLSPTVKTVKSIFSLVPNDQEKKLGIIAEIRMLIEDEAEGVVTGEDKERLDKLVPYLQVDEPFTWDEFPAKDKQKFINKRGTKGNFVFIYPSVPLREGKRAIEFRDDIGEISTASGKTYYASSSNIIFAEMLTILIKEGKLAVVLAFFVVFVIVYIDFRKFKSVMFVLTPLALGILWMGVVMFLTDMKFNLFNIVVIPSVIGIGVDNGVHIYHRYKEEGRGSLYHVLRNTGLAITMTTLTTIVGYSGLILARHPGLESIGDLAIIGLTATYLTAMVVMPALLQIFEKRESDTAESSV